MPLDQVNMTGIVDGVKVVSEHWGCGEKGCGERKLHRKKRKRQAGLGKTSVGSLGAKTTTEVAGCG